MSSIQIRKAFDRPTREELFDRLRAQPVRHLDRCAADVIRAERDAR